MCALRKKIPFKVVVTTGDNFYSPDGFATKKNYYDPERCLYSYPGHVWRAVWGNHDLFGSSTNSVLGTKERYYTWSSADVQFFMLDGNSAGDDQQEDWLERALKASRAPVKIAVFHQPVFTSGPHPDLVVAQRLWVPLFHRYGVQLVLNGHNHEYEHLREGRTDYVVTGGGGRSIDPCVRIEPEAIRCNSVYNFLIVTVTTSAIRVDAYRGDGTRFDRFSVAV
jgi:hypothetical protein